MNKKIVVGICGGSIKQRAEVLEYISYFSLGTGHDVTLPASVRSSVRRGEALEQAIESSPSSFVIASIHAFEEAEVVEGFGGQVVHIDGLPSDDIPMSRESILVTLNETRGRYISPAAAYAELIKRAA